MTTGTYLYYSARPFIPRTVQIALRRTVVRSMRRIHADTWPIDERTTPPPEGWPGWPEGKRFGLILTHDIESAQGLTRCRRIIDMETRFGLRSSFNIVPERYEVPPAVRDDIVRAGFEVGVHGLTHDGKLFRSRKIFDERAARINAYLRDWNAVGFRAPAMHHNLKWQRALRVAYDASTFDTDPFEPQPDAAGTIFPFWVPDGRGGGYVELPYTLPQDSTLFVMMEERTLDVWRRKLEWLVEHGGMALVIVHPDYMDFASDRPHGERYPAAWYEDFLKMATTRYAGQYWNGLPRELAAWVREPLKAASERWAPGSRPAELSGGPAISAPTPTGSTRYAILTAARNEAATIEKTIQSVVAQTVAPVRWIIVSDGSTDRTDEIVRSYGVKHAFIDLMAVTPDGTRNFGSKANAIREGYARLGGMAFDYVGILDADVSFAPNYYEEVLKRFNSDPDLGLAGGVLLDNCNGRFVLQATSEDWSVSGPVQMFRRTCYEAMGGYRTLRRGGIDAVAEVMVRMQGKRVRAFGDLPVLHHRRTGAEKGSVFAIAFRDGIKEYAYGTHPLFELAKCLRGVSRAPFLVGSLLRLAGYGWAMVCREPRPIPDEVLRFEQAEQLNRLRPWRVGR